MTPMPTAKAGGAGGPGTTVAAYAWSARAEQERLGEQAARRLQQTYDEEEQRHRKKVRSWQVHWCGGGGGRGGGVFRCCNVLLEESRKLNYGICILRNTAEA